jgi:hypothetical protein
MIPSKDLIIIMLSVNNETVLIGIIISQIDVAIPRL